MGPFYSDFVPSYDKLQYSVGQDMVQPDQFDDY